MDLQEQNRHFRDALDWREVIWLMVLASFAFAAGLLAAWWVVSLFKLKAVFACFGGGAASGFIVGIWWQHQRVVCRHDRLRR